MSGCPSVLWFGGSTWWHGARGPVRASLFSHPLLARLVRWAPTLDPAGSGGGQLARLAFYPNTYVCLSSVFVFVLLRVCVVGYLLLNGMWCTYGSIRVQANLWRYNNTYICILVPVSLCMDPMYIDIHRYFDMFVGFSRSFLRFKVIIWDIIIICAETGIANYYRIIMICLFIIIL